MTITGLRYGTAPASDPRAALAAALSQILARPAGVIAAAAPDV